MTAAGPPSSAVAAAFISTAIISCAPNALLFLFPNYGSSSSYSGRTILSLGQALAVGGLLGDVFLHTLPDCFIDSIGDGKNSNDIIGGFEIIGLLIILGFSFFLILDIFVRSLEGCGGGGGHSHKSNNMKTNIKKNNDDKRSHWKCLLSSSVLLNLLGDSLHNFTDGMAIGATYCITEMPNTQHSSFVSWSSSAFTLMKSKGGLASISVFLHEVPHELGDFATLVRSGLSRNQAIGCQFLTAIAAFAGTAFGLFSGQIIEGLDNDVLLPFTAGGTVHSLEQFPLLVLCSFILLITSYTPIGFLYLACTTILPDVLDSDVSAMMRLMQVGSFLLGIGLMYGVIMLEEMNEDHHHHKASDVNDVAEVFVNATSSTITDEL